MLLSNFIVDTLFIVGLSSISCTVKPPHDNVPEPFVFKNWLFEPSLSGNTYVVPLAVLGTLNDTYLESDDEFIKRKLPFTSNLSVPVVLPIYTFPLV